LIPQPRPLGPSPGFVSPRQGSNAPPHLFRRAQSLSARPPSIVGKRRAVLHERPLKKTRLSRSQSRHAKMSDLSRERAEKKQGLSENPPRCLCSRNRGLVNKDRIPQCSVVRGREAKWPA